MGNFTHLVCKLLQSRLRGADLILSAWRRLGIFSKVLSLVAVTLIGLPGMADAQGVVGAKFSIASGWLATAGAFDGTNFLVALQSDTSNSKVAAQLVSPAGTNIGLPVSLGYEGRSCCTSGVAFDGTNYLVAWEEDQGIKNSQLPFMVYGRFVNTSGAAVGAAFAMTSAGISFDGMNMLAYGGGKYLLTYTRLIKSAYGDSWTGRYVAGRIISPDGMMGSEFRISDGFGNGSSVTFNGVNGENFFVVWKEDSKDFEVRGRFVSPNGTLGREVSINASPAPSDNPVSVAFDGVNYMVVWSDQNATGWDIYAQRVSVNNADLVGSVTAVTSEPGSQMATGVSFNGKDYLVTWIDMTNDSNGNGTCEANEGSCWDVYGQLVGRDGVLVGSKFGINTDAGNQIGGVGCFGSKCLALISSGVRLGEGGPPPQVGEAYGAFLNPSFTASYLDPGYVAISFATLPFDTRAIAFDSSHNLYTASALNDNSGRVNIVAFTAASGYSASSTAYSFATNAASVTGLDFRASQLVVSESYASGNSGRLSDAVTGTLIKELPDFRPTGVDTRDSIVFSGRLKSNTDFGNVYKVNSDGSLSILIANLPLRGIATDASGNIFVSTRNSDFSSLLANSIYKFSATSGYSVASATRIITLPGGGGTELSFDNAGNLYTLYTPNPDLPTSAEIIQISALPSVRSTQVSLLSGWNLLGNSVNAPLTVSTSLGDASNVSTVWKWVTTGTTSGINYPTWAFYSPNQSDGGKAYAASKGYDFLTTINAGEGYWVNAKRAFTAMVPTAAPVASATFQGLAAGWHLISTGDTKTASAFNMAMSTTPPEAGAVPQNFTSLWAWDSTQSKWYFYAPSLEALGGNSLSDYISANRYMDFAQASKTLGPSVGFWMNKP